MDTMKEYENISLNYNLSIVILSSIFEDNSVETLNEVLIAL